MLNILLLEIFSIFPSVGVVVCVGLGFFGPFSLCVFGFLVVYSLYTPWGPFFFGFNAIAYLSKKKKKKKVSPYLRTLCFINSLVHWMNFQTCYSDFLFLPLRLLKF